MEQESGFNNWKAPERMNVDENSKNHRQCFTQWKELERNLFYNRGIIDAELQQQIQRENQKWCDILKRLLHCMQIPCNAKFSFARTPRITSIKC